MRRLAAGTLAMLLLGACGPRAPAPTMMRQHPELAARTAAHSRLAILPPRVRIWEMGFNDDETRLRDAEHQLETEITQLISAKLSAHHFTLLPARLDAADLDRQRALRFQLSERLPIVRPAIVEGLSQGRAVARHGAAVPRDDGAGDQPVRRSRRG